MFVNFSNHPSELWKDDQIAAAKEYGDIIDVPFPNVLPEFSEDDITRLADESVEKILSLKPKCVLCQGEFTLAFAVIKRLLAAGITTVAACTQRNVTIVGDVKMSEFKFSRFRKYI